jgi:hypothetical protein
MTMDKRALLSILAVSTIASATPGFQLGLGLGTLQTDMTPEHLGLESHLGANVFVPQVSLTTSAIRSISPAFALSLDGKINAAPIAGSTYLGIRSHFHVSPISSIGIASGIKSITIANPEDSDVSLFQASQAIIPVFSADITTQINENMYTSFEISKTSQSLAADSIHSNDSYVKNNFIDKGLCFLSLSQHTFNIIVGYQI